MLMFALYTRQTRIPGIL